MLHAYGHKKGDKRQRSSWPSGRYSKYDYGVLVMIIPSVMLRSYFYFFFFPSEKRRCDRDRRLLRGGRKDIDVEIDEPTRDESKT